MSLHKTIDSVYILCGDMVGLVAGGVTVPHDPVEGLHACSVLLTVKQWTLGARTPHLGTDGLQTVTQTSMMRLRQVGNSVYFGLDPGSHHYFFSV